MAGRARKRHRPPVHLPEAGLDFEGATGRMSNVFRLPGLAFISFVRFPQIGNKIRPETLKKIGLMSFFSFSPSQLKKVLDLQKMLIVSLNHA